MTERRIKVEQESPESKALHAIEGMYKSPDVQVAAQAHLDNLRGSIIFPDGEIIVTHPTAIYKLGLGGKRIEADYVFNGYQIREQVSVEDGKVSYTALVNNEKGEVVPQHEVVDPEKIAREVLGLAAMFHADSDYIRELIPQGLVQGAVPEEINYSPGVGIVVSRVPTGDEKLGLSHAFQGIEVEYLVLPVDGDVFPKWTYDEGLAVQALIKYRSIGMNLEIQTGLKPPDQLGFVVEYRSENPLTPDQQVELFNGVDIRGLNYAGKELRAVAH